MPQRYGLIYTGCKEPNLFSEQEIQERIGSFEKGVYQLLPRHSQKKSV